MFVPFKADPSVLGALMEILFLSVVAVAFFVGLSRRRRVAPENSKGRSLNILVLDEGDWSREVLVDPKAQTITHRGNSPDYGSIFHSLFEYRFEGQLILARLLEKCTDHYGKKDWDVRDGVVLESEIRERSKKSTLLMRTVEEVLAQDLVEVAWRPLEEHQVRFFVMLRHPDKFPVNEFRRQVRGELERIKVSTQKVLDVARSQGWEIAMTEEGVDFSLPETVTGEKVAAAELIFSAESLRTMGTSLRELGSCKKIERDLERILGDEDAA